MPKVAKKVVEALNLKTLADLGEIEFITSGIDEINAITGGFPKARVTEIFGMQGIGKTDLMLVCLSAASHEGEVLYIDAENALNPQRLIKKGGEAKNISISTAHIIEEVASIVQRSVGKYDLIVIDSVASLVPKSEAEGETGDQFVGLRARLMGQWMRKLIGPLGKSKTAVVFINQLRDSMIIYGDSQFTPGGKALPYAASLRLKLSTTRADRKTRPDGSVKGHDVQVEIVKSRICPPHQKTKFYLEY